MKQLVLCSVRGSMLHLHYAGSSSVGSGAAAFMHELALCLHIKSSCANTERFVRSTNVDA